MDLRQVRTFVTVAELGTVSHAAQQLHVAQPALSRQIAALESELGVPLFDRIAGRLQLSAAGERLLGDCRGLLNYSLELAEHAQLLRQPDAGVLKVAASPHFLESVFPGFLQVYARRFPNVQVKLVDIMGSQAVGMLERGEIHLAQSSMRLIGPGDQHLEGIPLQPVMMLAASHLGLKLGRGGVVEIADLAPHPLLQTGSEYLMRRTFDAACRMAGFEPNNALESRAPHALLAMAEAGHGVAIIPSVLNADRYRLRIARVTYRRKVLSEPLGLLFDRRRPLAPYGREFARMLAQFLGGAAPTGRASGGSKRRNKAK